MKKALSIILCISILAAGAVILASCGKLDGSSENTSASETPIESETEEAGFVGGFARTESPVITDEFKAVFDKAAAGLDGIDYTPVAYLASQIVAGKNHCVLCKASPVVPDAKTTYSIVYIYEDLQGNADIIEAKGSDAEAPDPEKGLMGGWAEPETPEMTDDARKALEKACETLTGAEYTPVALLGTQIVAGKNYRILCESKPSIPSLDSSYVIVTVYADLQGNAQITDTVEFIKNDIYDSSSAESAAE